jgi:hypothetical protein
MPESVLHALVVRWTTPSWIQQGQPHDGGPKRAPTGRGADPLRIARDPGKIPFVMPRGSIVVWVGMMAGCGFDASGMTGPVTLGMDGGETASATSGAEGAEESSASASASASDVTGGDPATESGSSTLDSGGTTGVTGATDDDAPTTEGETTEAPPPAEEHLTNTDHALCGGPIWCFYSPGNDPAGPLTWAQECFTPSLTPPYEITEVHWTVADAGASPVQMQVQLRSVVDGRPGATIDTSSPLPVSYSQPGEHTYVFQNPEVLNDPGFCIGLRIPEGGTSGAVGIARVDTNEVPGVSWLRIQMDGQGCNTHPNWLDTTTATMHGNLCIGVTVREVR